MLIVFTRALILYALVVVVMRMMGKRQIAEMQPFELVITIMIADLAATPMENAGVPLLNGVIPIMTLLSAQVLVSYLSLKSETFREIVCGKPSLLIDKGNIVQSEVRRLRININDLLEQLRSKNYPNLSDVEFAILETNGQITIIPKAEKRNVITSDMGIPVQPEELPITLIIDGKIIEKNLQKTGFDRSWLMNQLKNNNIDNIENVFFGFLSSEKLFYAQEKEKSS
ncbi:hypothetical membrane protein UPF0702 [Clostridium aceticum]|uniref:Hypothetical membrane protein UPF0702 n=1 Tax=Clostridium aceticum TaxID=84022 RepID=A0A0D8IB01_9CLOT|nr:DUF421 domain-containing protein [Clostridium aceticum]AKL96965.1 hypothetical membrane protein UPF0702 [Clostridium aceticum]KJF27433.1 membrane protein [Clostridium aceticum]